jgi:crotonobetainyl-CoA:carnitine CoA-transferase CaiB-like acyl-CoA transferase
MAAEVLDLSTSLGGAYAARLLSAGGVHVTRAEPPEGHWLRRWSASGSAMRDGGDGALFRWLAGGQDSIVERADIEAACADVDAVLWSPGALVDLAAVTAPVVVALSPFGTTGPWVDRPATELTLQAMSGGPALRGSREWPPVTAGGQHGEYMAGVFAAVACLLALRQRAQGGPGGLVDVSALESVIMTQLFNPITMETVVAGVRPRRYKATVADVVPTRDGFVGFAVVNRLQHWLDFCTMIGHQDWADDPTLYAVVNRAERSDELNPVIWAWAAERTTAEIVELAALWRVPAIEVGHGASIPRMDQFAGYGFFDTNPSGFLQPSAPFRMHPAVPGVGEVRPSPSLGEHGPRRTRRPAVTGIADGLPLAGIRVADFTSFWAGPFLAHTMAMFGADVIHVESAGRPDGARLMNWHAPSEPQWWEWSSYFQATNTNKRGITLDLTTDAGRALAHRLIAECDVVVENASPRVMDGFGLSWQDVHATNPAALMVRMPAFGLGGPWRDRTGFAMTMEQVSGMAWISGPTDQPPGALFGPCDPSAGLHALIGLLVALEDKDATGDAAPGRLIEVPMVGGALSVCAEQVIEHSAYGVLLSRAGNRGPAAAPQGCYATADDDLDLQQHRWVAIAVATDAQWDGMRCVLGDPAWAAPLTTAATRHRAHDLIDEHLSAWCASRGADEIVDALIAAGVPAAVVVHPSAQLGFEQLQERGFFEQVEHPICGPSTHVTFPFRLPEMTGRVHRHPAPTLGQHNDEVLGGLLGLPLDEIEALRSAGVIGTALR